MRKEIKASEGGECVESSIAFKAFQKKGSRKPDRVKERANEREEKHK